MKKRYTVSWDQSHDNIEIINGKCRLKGSAFILKEYDYWVGYTDNYHLTMVDKMSLGIDFKPSDTFNIQDKKIYRFPKLDLPRQKVDLLKEKYNVKVIRDPEKADIHVVSNKLMEHIVEYNWSTSSSFKYFFDLIKSMKDEGHLTECAVTAIKNILSITGPDSMIKIENKYHYHNTQSGQLHSFISKMSEVWGNEEVTCTKDMYISEKNVKDFINLKSIKATAVYDTDIISIIDGELAVIDNVEYEGIRKMITNNDRDNRTLALEMLANCNVEKSFDVVSGIFYWCNSWIRDTNNWNSVNVKALRNRMKDYDGHHQTNSIWSYNHYINLLIKDKKLTEFALNRTRKKLYDQVLCEIVGDSASVFNVKLDDLKLKETLTKNLIND